MTKTITKYIGIGGLSIGLLSLIVGTDAKVSSFNHAAIIDANRPLIAVDTPETDAPILPYDFQDQSTGDPLNYPNSGGLMMSNPANITTNVEYDPTSGNYIIERWVTLITVHLLIWRAKSTRITCSKNR